MAPDSKRYVAFPIIGRNPLFLLQTVLFSLRPLPLFLLLLSLCDGYALLSPPVATPAA